MNKSFFTKVFSALLIVLLALGALPITLARAATITVTTNAVAVAVNGACSLPEAIANANNDAATNADCSAGAGADVIVFNIVAASPTITLAASLPNITDNDGLTIDGTNLNALGGTVTISGNNAFRIVSITGTGANTFRDLIMINGAVAGDGGAINNVSNLTIDNVTFRNNRGTGNNNGGALYHNTGSLSISNSTFGGTVVGDANYTGAGGGAIYIAGGAGTMTITNTTFQNNRNAAIDNGGAIYLNGGTLSINNSTFDDNRTNNGEGGAIYQNGGTLNIGTTTGNTFTGNDAVDAEGGGTGQGGAIYKTAGDMTIGAVGVANNFGSNTADGTGGAIYVDGTGSYSITAASFTSNTAADQGGAIHNDNETATITGSTFTSNTSSNNDGGAIFHENGGTLTITTSAFSTNTAPNGNGGAIASDQNLSITSSTFTSNSADGEGGAIDNNGGTSAITSSTFTSNSSTGDRGGAVSNHGGGTLTIATSIFSSNTSAETAGGDGGGAIYNSGTMTITDTTLNANTTTVSGAEGGALFNEGGTLTIQNSTFFGNQTPAAAGNLGGAIYTLGGTVNISFVSFSNNLASATNGSDIHAVDDGGTDTLNIFRSFLVNPATSAINCFSNLDTENTTNSLIEGNAAAGNSCGAAASTAFTDALTLANNGGPTQTLAITSSMTGIYNAALACTNSAGAAVATDQRGTGRPQGASCDLGAFEAPATITLTLQKTVVNDNGGTAVDTAWTLSATGPTNISGVEGNAAVTNAVVSAGNYTLNESGGPAGYATSGIWACSGFTSGSQTDDDTLTLGAGDNVTCVITNEDIVPTLTLLKTVINDNGGTALDTAWTLNAAGPTNISGVEGNATVTNASVNAGNYTLTESGGPAGYTQTGLTCSGAADLNPADGLAIAVGENVTCTITNNDNAPTLTLDKVVVNDNGGTALASAWTLTATGNPVTNPATLSGAGAAGSTDVVSDATFDAGTYDLSETAGPAGYTASAWVCVGGTQVDGDTITIALGQNVTCTITNNDNAPTLTLDKAVFNNNGGTAAESAWTLTATGNPVTNPATLSGAGAAGGTDVVSDATFDAGTYDLSESAGPAGYTASAWVCVGGTQVDSDTVTIALGQNVTCTIANNDNVPTLTLNKVVVNDNGGTAAESAWTLTATGNPVTNPATLSGAGAAGSTDVVSDTAFDAGTYDLSETAGPAGYTASAWVCVGGTQVDGDTITLALGQTATCTITNDDVAPTLTLVKTATNDNGGTALDTAWTLNAAGPTNISGIEGAAAVTNAVVSAGSYTLTESGGPAGYTQTGITCSGSDANGADGLTLLPGETVTCTFANNDNAPGLTLLKTVVSDNGGTALDTAWTLNAAGPTPISGVEGAVAVTGATVSAGNYTLTESGGPAGYTQTGLTCSGAADADPTDGLTIALGETVTCTFTNNDIAPTLTLVKTVVNDNGGLAADTDWTLNTTGPTAISGIEGAAAVTNATVDAGNYTLGESGPANYTQTGIACSGSDANGADGLTLLPGETVTCTYTNNDVAAVLTLLKIVVNDNGGLAADTAWTLNAAGPTPISGVEGAAAVTNAAVNAGAYTLTESGGPSGYTQTGLVCSGAADANPNDGLTIALGETITCTFTNNDIAPTLTLVKDVTNNDGGTNVIGDWTLDASGPSIISGVTGAGAVTNAIVDAGSYSLGETAIAGYTQTAITCTGSDANGADGLDLDPGENVTCTFFNDDIGATLTLVKDVTNNNIGTAVDTDWILTATGPSTISGIELSGAVTGAGVSAGNYILTESGPANYTQTAITCTGSDANGADGLTLALGEIVTCTFFNDDDVPVLLVPNVNSAPNTGDATIAENEVIVNTLNISQLIVQFNWDADNPAGTSGTDDVDNPNNYILLYSATGTFNTPSCAVVAGGGVVAPDIRIPVTTVAYSNGGGSGPFIATLNLSAPLTNAGYYRLFVCGTTSIVLAADPTVALSGNGAVGTDFIRNFQLTSTPAGGGGGGAIAANEPKISVAALPATGFAPNRVTMLAEQPEDLAYANLGDLWIEVPALGVKTSIVGVPQTAEGEWDVTWLANNVGWLNGTAFPTWEGNSVVTAHVTNADGLDGPFANLNKLKFGDQIIVHAFGQKYIFELRNSRMVKPFSTSFAFEDLEDESYLTLITCQVYLPKSDTYLYRRVIRAVLVKVETE